MSTATVTIEEAQARLPELISGLSPGAEVVIRDGDRAVARLVAGEDARRTCSPGSAKDIVLWMSPDFDAPLDDFAEYGP